MTPNAAHKIINDRFIAQWPVAFPSVVYALENEKLDPPEPGEFVAVSLRDTPSDQHTLAPVGKRIFDRRGFVLVRIYTAVESGLQRLDSLMKTARDIYEGVSDQGVSFLKADYRIVGEVNGRCVGTVSVPFWYRETK